MKVTFLILHYYTYEDTVNCVESILNNLKNQKYQIVIVDNGSKNNSGKNLEKLYFKNKDIHLILLKENQGFAKGNNIGFKYIKDHIKTDFIVMLNNDTLILQVDFISQLEKEYSLSNFSVLGPKILLPENNENPIQEKLPSVKSLKKYIFKIQIFRMLHFFYLYNSYEYLKKFIKKYSSKNLNFSLKNYNFNTSKRQENVILHGCFLVFSKNYIEKFDGLDDRTFLYMEEKLLQCRLLKNNLKSVYCPKIAIFHNEDSSTKAVMKSQRKKELFTLKHATKSAHILLSEIKELEKINEKELN